MNDDFNYDEVQVEFERAIDGEVTAKHAAEWVWANVLKLMEENKELTKKLKENK